MSDEKLKTCTSCQQTFPKTSDHWFFVKRANRPAAYAQPRCKPCSNDYNKNYRQANRVKLRESQRAYDRTPKGIYKKLCNSERNHAVTISQENFIKWYKSQPRKCSYCGLEESRLASISDSFNNKVFRLTIDRMDTVRPYEEHNLTLACFRCNHIKGDFFSASEMEQIGRLFIAPKWRINGQQA